MWKQYFAFLFMYKKSYKLLYKVVLFFLYEHLFYMTLFWDFGEAVYILFPFHQHNYQINLDFHFMRPIGMSAPFLTSRDPFNVLNSSHPDNLHSHVSFDYLYRKKIGVCSPLTSINICLSSYVIAGKTQKTQPTLSLSLKTTLPA